MAAPFQPIPTGLLDQWGRSVDRSWYDNWSPQANPDTTTTDEYFDISNCPQIVAGMVYSDISPLFVSARGIDDDDGAFFPPQLIYTSDQIHDQEVLDVCAWQFDEAFDGGFPAIIRSLDNPAKTYGRCIAELEFETRSVKPYKGKVFVRMAYSRDPERYLFDLDGKPGLYRNDGFGTYTPVDPTKFFSYAFNPLFNNPYGSSINLPLKPWIETFNKIFGYWRHALEKAGLGSWTASYPNAWTGNTADAKQRRADLLEQIGNLAAGTKGIFPEGANIQAQKLQMEAQAFLDWYSSFAEIVSLIHTGTTTALKEGEFGSKSAKESTDVREKANLEKINAARVSAAWTYRFIPNFCRFNFRPSRLLGFPTLQLIAPNLMTPTTPEGQMTAKESVQEDDDGIRITTEKKDNLDIRDDDNAEMMAGKMWLGEWKDGGAAELQEDEKKPVVPVAIPAGYENFPNTDPNPPIYFDVMDYARDALAEMEVKEYQTVQPSEANNVFTVKRLRNYTTDVVPVLTALKTAVDITLDTENEAKAWEQYYALATEIFKSNGIDMDVAIRDDLNISFRQARQNVFGDGMFRMAQEDPEIVGIKIVNRDNVDHHQVHTFWDGVALPKDHPELQKGGRLRTPMDFGCVCYYDFVRNASELTPESGIPSIYPGETYAYYAQPDTKEPTTQ